MNILLLGATGLLGSALTRELSKDNSYKLTLFARHTTNKYNPTNNISVIDGDATIESDLQKSIINQDVIICAISGNELPQIANNLVHIMSKEDINRLIFMGAVGIYNEIPDEMDGEDNLDNEPAQIPNRQAADIIESSTLNYTILRPGYLRSGDTNDFVLTSKGEKAKGYISTISSVVKLIVSLINDNQLFSCQSISITKDMTK